MHFSYDPVLDKLRKKGVHSKANSAMLEKKKSHFNCRINIVRILHVGIANIQHVGIANIQHLAFDEAAYRQHQQNYIFGFIWED